MTICKICGSQSKFLFQEKILNKYDVDYYKCTECGFVQTEEPYWLNEAYSNAITSLDIGLLGRNIYYLPIVSSIIKSFFKKEASFLDYGGGYGIFVRLMRDKGFNFYRYDTYCENIFAKGHDEDSDNLKYELVTSFEVFEHLSNPIEEISKMLQKSRNIFFSTELQPEVFTQEKDWWYVAPQTGQHISFYTMDSLKYIAKKFNLNLYSNGQTFHLLTEKKISKLKFKLATNRWLIRIVNRIIKSPGSLLPSDFYNLTNNRHINN